MDSNNRKKKTSRRNVLKSIGASGVGVAASPPLASLADVQVLGAARADPDDETDTFDRSLVIEANEQVAYEFSVTGLLSAADAPEDAVDMGTGSATTEDDRHSFSFTGEFTSFEIDGDADVTVDGESFEYETFPHNTLKIVAHEDLEYDVSASGAVEIESGDAEKRGDRRVTGSISRGDGSDNQSNASSSHTLAYAGELTYLDVDGDARVINDSLEIDPDNSLLASNPAKSTIRPIGPRPSEYRVQFTHKANTNDNNATVRENIIRGTVNKPGTKIKHIGDFHMLKFPDTGSIKKIHDANMLQLQAFDKDLDIYASTVSESGDENTEKVTVKSGEEDSLRYNGSLSLIQIVSESAPNSPEEGIELDLDFEGLQQGLSDTVKLQQAAQLERLDEFETLIESADGRVRYDAKGISVFYFSGESASDEKRGIVFKLTNTGRLDRGDLWMRYESDSVVGAVHYENWTPDNLISEVQADYLNPPRPRTQTASKNNSIEDFKYIDEHVSSVTGAQTEGGRSLWSVKTKYNVDAYRELHKRANQQQVSAQILPSSCDDLPVGSNTCKEATDVDCDDLPAGTNACESATDAGKVVVETATELEWSELAPSSQDFGLGILADTVTAQTDLVAEVISQSNEWSDDLARGIQNAGLILDLAVEFGNSDFAHQMLDGTMPSRCSACGLVGATTWTAGVGLGSAYACGKLSLISAGLGTYSCATAAGTVLNAPDMESGSQLLCSQIGIC